VTTEVSYILGFFVGRPGELLGYCSSGILSFLIIWLRFLTVESNSNALTNHYWYNLLDIKTKMPTPIKVKVASYKVSLAGIFGSINTALSANNPILKLVMRIIM
jgi:hypothetical protein